MQLLRMSQVRESVGLSKTQLYRLIAAGQFPQQIKIGSRASGWLLEEVDQWVQARANERRPVQNAARVAT